MKLESPKIKNEQFKGNNWTLDTDIGLVDPANSAFGELLARFGWDADDIANLQMAFGEALTNAIAHGNLGIVKTKSGADNIGKLAEEAQAARPTNKKVYVTVDAGKDRVTVKIRDEGEGFKVANVPDPTTPEGLAKATGRGLLLMRAFFDSVTYNEKGNEVTMVKEKKGV
jgi:anti-sigma regulatory factor (Ser/Thr protein kinase)